MPEAIACFMSSSGNRVGVEAKDEKKTCKLIHRERVSLSLLSTESDKAVILSHFQVRV